MKLVKIEDLFYIKNGNNFSYQHMSEGEILFIARGSTNNGIIGYVQQVEEIIPFDSNQITVSLSGSVLETFLQKINFIHLFMSES